MKASFIKDLIKKNINIENIFINSDDNVHFQAIIVSNDFENLNLINRQRKVNKILNDFFIKGEIHALTLKTYTLNEWEKIKLKCF